MSPVPRYALRDALPIFSQGFRPFFAAGAFFAAIAIPIWLLIYSGRVSVLDLWSPMDLHAHEMIFGWLGAVVAGFLLTAVPNWTGRLPLQGWPLASLVLLWGLARVFAFFAGHIGAAAWLVIDLAFPAALFVAIAREIIAGKNWRNLRILAILGGLILSNLAFHWQAGHGDAAMARRAGLALMIMLIALIGGRIVPSFTANWLRSKGGRLPVSFNHFDSAVMSATGVALLSWISLPGSIVTGALALLAGILQAIRLARWAGDRTLDEPILFILHVGYGFVAFGFLLLAGATLTQRFTDVAAIHAFGVGACGIMPLAVMTRVALAHTRRAIHADRVVIIVYGLIVFATLARIATALGQTSLTLLWIAGLAWSGAFGLFLIRYFPILFGPSAGPGRA